MKHLSFYSLCILFGCLIFSCTDEATQIKQLLEKKEAIISKKLAHIEHIGALNAKLIGANTALKELEPIYGFKLFKQKVLPSANAVVIDYHQFDDLTQALRFKQKGTKQDKVKGKLLNSYRIAPEINVINKAASLVKHQRLPSGVDSPEIGDYREAFRGLEQLNYLVVTHDLVRVAPVLLEDNGFTMGTYSGYAIVYNVESAQFMGGFLYETQSSKAIKSYSINNQSLTYYHLMRDYVVNIQKTFKKALKQHTSQ